VGEGSTEPEEEEQLPAKDDGPPSLRPTTGANNGDEDDEDEEEEPRLKYADLTKNLMGLYRNGDAASAFFVAGDKLIIGTHNGNVHVLALPSLEALRVYHAHSASVSSISISPYPPPISIIKLDLAQRIASDSVHERDRTHAGSPAGKNSPRRAPVPNVPSNQIFIATASIDGNVCVSSLVDSKDQLRNFGRPVQSVALSPEYKLDRNYLSGGQAGSLILTNGGQVGRRANATTTGAAAAASGWLGSIGLGENTGTDKVLHSGEGIISMIRWSLTGKYVLWVNEQGIKIMRSDLHLESHESGYEWKRISHIDKPNRREWDDMAGVWKARVEWIDRANLDTDDETSPANGVAGPAVAPESRSSNIEEVLVGWGDTTWLIRVFPGSGTAGQGAGEKKVARAEVATM
jgi:vacuolar protein sorting-associated protein 41